MPPQIAALAPGEELTIWAENEQLWQLARGDVVLLSYQQTLAADNAQTVRKDRLFAVVLALGVAAAAFGELWRRRRGPEAARPRTHVS